MQTRCGSKARSVRLVPNYWSTSVHLAPEEAKQRTEDRTGPGVAPPSCLDLHLHDLRSRNQQRTAASSIPMRMPRTGGRSALVVTRTWLPATGSTPPDVDCAQPAVGSPRTHASPISSTRMTTPPDRLSRTKANDDAS